MTLIQGGVLVLGSTSLEIRFPDSVIPHSGEPQTIMRSIVDLSKSWASRGVESTDLQSPTVGRLRDLVEIAKGLNLAVSIEAIFERAREVVFRYLRDVERVALLVDVDGDGELTLLNWALRDQGVQPADAEGGDWISRSICRKAFDERLAIQTADAQNDRRFGEAKSIFFKGIRSAMAVPLWNDDKVVGVFYADAQIPSDRWEESGSEDLVFFSSLANLVATAVQRWQMAEKLRAEGIIRQRLERVAQFLETQQSEVPDKLIGKSPVIKKLGRKIQEQAGSGETLLLQGETGTGKELIARLIHLASERKAAVFFSVDCSEISENDWGDKLFGTYRRDGYEDAPTGPFCYLELCQGGSILLRNIEDLPLSIQERLTGFLKQSQQGEAAFCDVRAMVACRGDFEELVAAGRIMGELAQILVLNVLPIAPLRERKKDIPYLAEYFLKKYSERLGKPVRSISDDAVTKLISYGYHWGNVRELEDAIRRAVILAESEVIHSEAIFLGPPPAAPHGFNWLTLPKPVVGFGVRILPRVLQVAAALSIVFILYECFFGPSFETKNLGTLLVWSVWWPLLAISFLAAGRIWCAACPMGQASNLVESAWGRKLKVPGWLKNNDTFLVMGGFSAIVWVEEATKMRESPAATGFLLLAILAGAVSFGVLFPRRTWCRYACPLGGLAGICASSSVVQLRPTFDVCSAKCEGHDCFRGTDKVPGCPLFNHLMFVDSNQHCVLCMNCVQNCPNSSPRFSLRAPGRELWSNAQVQPETAKLIVLLLGLLAGMSWIQFLDRSPSGFLPVELESHRVLLVTLVMIVMAFLPVLLLFLWERRRSSAPSTDGRAEERVRRIRAFVPLLTCGLIAFQLGSIPGMEWLNASLTYHGRDAESAWISLPMLPLLQVAILSLGLTLTLFVLWKLKSGSHGDRTGSRPANDRASLLGAAAYWALLVVLLAVPR
jgi:transcriptional regulator with GAF, ATPase, and Fis domain/polyferredoxin